MREVLLIARREYLERVRSRAFLLMTILFPLMTGLLIGGSVSNLVDRVRLGHVTDFIDFGWWPAFNLADSFIVIGVGILLAAVVAADRRPKQAPRHLDVAAR